jgi:hypothetical protein
MLASCEAAECRLLQQQQWQQQQQQARFEKQTKHAGFM